MPTSRKRGNIFSKTSVDIVGPLRPCTVPRNRFILTVINFASHFPLGYRNRNRKLQTSKAPLKSQAQAPAYSRALRYPAKTYTAANIVRCLILVFTTFGFPDQMLSDCGSEFLSQLMQLFLLECKVAQFKTSPYHPQSNRCLEQFNRTLKTMLKGVGETFPDWDQLLPWVLFAYREVPVEGLMFSPFDLVFGRNTKGVLQLNDSMPEKVRSQNVIDYILQLRDRIRSSHEIVNANEEIAKKRSKVWYDRNR